MYLSISYLIPLNRPSLNSPRRRELHTTVAAYMPPPSYNPCKWKKPKTTVEHVSPHIKQLTQSPRGITYTLKHQTQHISLYVSHPKVQYYP